MTLRSLRSIGASLDRKKALDQLRRSIDIDFVLDLIGATNISIEDNEHIHSCPLPFGLHPNGDRNPSSSINSDTLLFNCYVCGGGDVFWLVANVLDVPISEAVNLLLGAIEPKEMTVSEFTKEIERIFEEADFASLALPTYSERMLSKWVGVHPYFTGRGVSGPIQTEMSTGVDPNHRELYERDDMSEWFIRPRAVIPVFFGGKLRGWQKRKLDNEPYGAKYLGSRGLPRRYLLYGWDRLTDDRVVLVESPMSVLSLISVGVGNAVASFGSEVSADQIELLRSKDRVTLFMDNDHAGRYSTDNLIDELSPYTDVHVVEMGEEGQDPADLVGIYGPEAVLERTRDGVPAVAHRIKGCIGA